MQKILDIFECIHSKPFLSLITGGLILVIGVLISDIPKMVVNQGWPSTQGAILHHRFLGQKFKEYDGDFYTNVEVSIRYQYTVEGISYTSLSINSINPPFNLYPASYASRYPVGKEVIVYYNPKSPSQAVLEPGFVDVLKGFDVFSYILFGIGVLFIYLGISKVQKNKYIKRWEIPE